MLAEHDDRATTERERIASPCWRPTVSRQSNGTTSAQFHSDY
jgi:hypothetical protein